MTKIPGCRLLCAASYATMATIKQQKGLLIMEENKEIIELLKKLDESSQKRVRLGRILCVLALVAALFCGATFAVVFSLVPQVETVLTQVQPVLGNLEQTSQQLAALDLEGMVSNVDALVVTGQQTLQQSMEKLDTVDFDALNQAIRDLSAVIEPLAKWGKIFQR